MSNIFLTAARITAGSSDNKIPEHKSSLHRRWRFFMSRKSMVMSQKNSDLSDPRNHDFYGRIMPKQPDSTPKRMNPGCFLISISAFSPCILFYKMLPHISGYPDSLPLVKPLHIPVLRSAAAPHRTSLPVPDRFWKS